MSSITNTLNSTSTNSPATNTNSTSSHEAVMQSNLSVSCDTATADNRSTVSAEAQNLENFTPLLSRTPSTGEDSNTGSLCPFIYDYVILNGKFYPLPTIYSLVNLKPLDLTNHTQAPNN